MTAFLQYKTRFLFYILFFAFNAKSVAAQPLQKAENILANNKNNWSFEENRGQLADENGVVLKDIKYYGRDKEVAVYLRKNKISFVFTKTEPKNKKPAFSEATGAINSPPFKKDLETPEEVKILTSRIDLEIAGANPETQILAEEKISYYTNYYLAHTPEEGITNVPHYKKITYKNIYSNIDLMLHIKEKGMKYEFVVHPNGKVSDIKLSWNGTKPDVLQNGGIKYASALGEIKESAPFSFISEDGKEVKSGFKVKGNKVGFEVGKYDEDKDLVIDPMLVWGTYYGGDEDEQAWGITTDKSNNVFITGQTRSTTGIATTGAHQVIFKGAMCAFITKLNNNGVRQWGTYYGGDSGTIGWAIKTDRLNNIYVTGSTSSKSGIATSSAHQTYYAGGTGSGGDAFLAKFNNSGLRLWGTYYGGAEGDNGFGITTDITDNVYITGITKSTYNIATPNSHQEFYSDNLDGFVAKFNSNGSRIWATYYGGNNSDYGINIVADTADNIFFCGRTFSASNIATSGTHQETIAKYFNQGFITSDAFIVKFDTQGTRQWGTYYGGQFNELFNGIALDSKGNILVIGTAESNTGIATSDAHQPSIGGNSDAFIVKFNNTGKREWATYFGGSGNDYGKGIVTDKNDNIYITGPTASKWNIATGGTHQTQNKGASAYLAKFNSKGTRQWGTFYGGGNGDDAMDIALDDSGYIYITGRTNSTSGIATPDAHKSSLPGIFFNNQDAFIAKFLSSFPPYNAGIISIDSPALNICADLYNINVKFKNYTYLLPIDSIKIGFSINGILQNEFNWQGKLKAGDTTVSFKIGAYIFNSGPNTIKVWTTLPNGTADTNNGNDTFQIIINVIPLPDATTGSDKTICIGENTSIGANSVAGYIYSWTSKPAGFISSLANPVVNPLITTVYYLTETNATAGCTKTDSVVITVVPIPTASITGDSFICKQNYSVYQAVKLPSAIYKWSVSGGNISAGQGTDSILVLWDTKSKTETIKLTVTTLNACAGATQKIISFYQSPILNIGPDAYICEEDGNLIKLNAGKEFTTYRWYPTGDTTSFLLVRKAGDYYVLVQDKCGNEMQDDIKIAAKCPVAVYIPNAFTPDDNSLNDVFRPVGNHISGEEYSFKIYNRWGERVFISNNYNNGWDGNYIGKVAADGVYLWILECTVKEGTIKRKLNKSGTVQLIR